MYKTYSLVYRFFIILVLLPCFVFKSTSGSSINLFLRPAPKTITKQVKQTLVSEGVIQGKITKLHEKSAVQVGKKMLKNGFKKLLPKVGGFVALYGGYVDYSDKNGNIVFPLLHKDPKVYLVVTPRVELVTIHGNTLSHKTFSENIVAKQYLFEKKVDKNKISYWQVSEEAIPAHKRINPLAIVLLTKPKNLVVPTGDFMTTEQANLVLPKVYVVGNFENTKTLLDFLDIRRFFEQIEREGKMATGATTQELITNN